MSTPRFGRVLTAMVTPFASSGAVDFDVAAKLARYLVAEGSDGLVVGGSTGEGSSLSDEEKLDLFACVAEAVTVPVLAGSTFANTQQSVVLTAQVKATGVAGVLATTPAYARPNQAGIAAHLGAIAESTPLEVMLYDIPIRTGRKIASATTIGLVKAHKNVTALKDASGDLVSAAHTKAVLGDALSLYSGDDSVLLPFLGVGAVGIVSVAAHWVGPEVAGIVHAAALGEWQEAQMLNERAAASFAFESTEAYPNPMPAKAVLRVLGFNVGECRLPHAPSDTELNAAAAEIVSSLKTARG
ncbi:MAG TPA: 4-hydroxy-tetrahydrodipicolinate synthase [Acidimicrobiales bacterium]|nr:4-hydroxy-tetrahydrodipicolinate synthase [Acidimicrobiales bacterium]